MQSFHVFSDDTVLSSRNNWYVSIFSNGDWDKEYKVVRKVKKKRLAISGL